MPSKTENSFVFLDRDGTIIEDRRYAHKIKDLKFLPGAVSGLKKLIQIGYKLIIISNQAGIARKIYSKEEADMFNWELIAQLAKHGVIIEKIYMCPHHPEFTGPCSCRKPEPGLAKLAAKEFNINLKKSYFVGDKDCDIELGKNCGGKTFLIDNGQYETTIKPNYRTANILKVADILASLT